MSRRHCLSLKHAMYLACKRTIPRSGCNTGERGTRPDCIPAANALVNPLVRRSYVEASGGYLDSLSTVQTVGGTSGQQTVQYNITIQATATSHRRRYRAVTAQHINRGARPVRPLSFPLYLALPFIYRTSLFPRGAAYISAVSPSSLSRVTPLQPLCSHRHVPSPFDRVPSPFYRATISDWLDH